MMALRSLTYNVFFVAATLAYGTAGVFVRVFARERALGLAMAWGRALLAGARAICGITVVVSGREHLPDGPALIASQHQSAFDTLVWLTLVERPAYVFKAELGSIPLFGPMLVAAGQIPLDRGAGFGSIKGLLRRADAAVLAGRQIVIFPEGTRVAPGTVGELRPGVAALSARTKLPVVPVATDSGRLWGRRAFMKRPGPIHIMIGRPIAPGLPSGAMVAAIRQGWAEAAAGCG